MVCAFQVRTKAGTRATEAIGTRDTVTRATTMVVDTVAMATMITPLVTMDMALDMITVSIDLLTFI